MEDYSALLPGDTCSVCKQVIKIGDTVCQSFTGSVDTTTSEGEPVELIVVAAIYIITHIGCLNKG